MQDLSIPRRARPARPAPRARLRLVPILAATLPGAWLAVSCSDPPETNGAAAAGASGGAASTAMAGSAGSPAAQGGDGGGSAAGGDAAGGDAAGGDAAGGAGGVEAAGGSLMLAGGSAGAEAAAGAGGMDAPPADPCLTALFCDDFEDDVADQFPLDPWRESTNGASVVVDEARAFSGTKAVHVNVPPSNPDGSGVYRRGYFALQQGSSPIFPGAAQEMYGRAMMWLDATPDGTVHWTMVQGEGRSGDDTHNRLYRYGGQQQGGAGLMANYETTDGVATDCWDHSQTTMPTGQWACVEWRFVVASNEMQMWLDGTELADIHVTGSGEGCLGQDLNEQWLAPPAFQSLYLGWERYQAAGNDRNLWVDDVVVSTERVGCPE